MVVPGGGAVSYERGTPVFVYFVYASAAKGPSWGHPDPVLEAVIPFLWESIAKS